MPLIEVKNLTKIYLNDGIETLALRGVCFTVEQGDFTAIMGPSGSGKSTLLHILGFLESQTSGEYYFDGKTADGYSKNEIARLRNKKIGFIFQAFNLLRRTSVLENVKLPLLYSDVPEREWDERAKKAIESVGLSHRLNYEPSRLSGGEQQRAAIARALVNNPYVLFADEPTGNLDSQSGQTIMEILKQLNAAGRAIIMITHELEMAQQARRIIKLRDGRIENDSHIRH